MPLISSLDALGGEEMGFLFERADQYLSDAGVPSGGLGIVLAIVIMLMWMRTIHDVERCSNLAPENTHAGRGSRPSGPSDALRFGREPECICF